MPLFYFHTQDGAPLSDSDGTELEDADAARIEASRILGQLVEERPSHIWLDHDFRITVMDESGAVLFALALTEATMPAAPASKLNRGR
ncbi:hypothetical protein [Phenylobacterium sp.]|uniref:DUF6894 family protein n=1 Tax=Phenylobacterium sp. TaxID=1871053 RepID=UPI00273451A0|nr:hypothetical protein [Phenylobacterium sp.]MDP3660287.1 hypothetical protein [Phenylobacterium sp.]